MVVFEREDEKNGETKGEQEPKRFGFSVGSITGASGGSGGDYRLYIDDMLYLDDPHQLYRHWPAEAWQAVDQHQVRKGMSELQVGFALGAGDLHGSGLGPTRVLTYPNNGKPLVVTFEHDKAVDIQPAPAGP